MNTPRYRVKSRVQAYFDEHQVKRVGSGNQSIVYGDDKLVVKTFRPISSMALKLQEKGIMLGPYETHKMAKEKLGDLASPFEIAEGVNLKIMGAMGVEQLTFDQAIIQEVSRRCETVEKQLRGRSVYCETDKLKEIFDLIIEFRMRLLQRGAYFHDSQPDNLILRDGHLMLRDIGAIKFLTRDQIMKISDSWFRKVIAGRWVFASYSFFVSRKAKKALGQDWTNFRKKFMEYYDPEKLGKMFLPRQERRGFEGKGRGRNGRNKHESLIVPDVTF